MPSPKDLSLKDINRLILTVRGHKIILDFHLAELYGVTTKALNQAVKRNKARFPESFVFRLSKTEADEVRSHFVTLQKTHFRYPPYVFTEHGALMAATVLKGHQATAMSLYVIQAFVQMRRAFMDNQSFAKRLAEIEKTLAHHDAALRELFKVIKPLLLPPPEKPKRRMGFHEDND